MLTMRQKKAITRELRDRYRKSSKKEKTIMLDEFIRLTRYNRSYAARVLRIKEVLGYMHIAGKRVRLVRDNRKIKRTITFWDEKVPGFFEVDLVSHDGGAIRGDFIQSLNFTDISTSWEEMIAVKNNAQVCVFEGIKEIEGRLPFSIPETFCFF